MCWKVLTTQLSVILWNSLLYIMLQCFVVIPIIFFQHWIRVHSKVLDFGSPKPIWPMMFLSAWINGSMWGNFNPFSAWFLIKARRFNLSICPSHKKKKTISYNCLFILSGVFGRTVKHWTKIGSANVLMTVISQINDIFLRDHTIKGLLIFFIFFISVIINHSVYCADVIDHFTLS